jgi:hypothetical protein
MDGCMDGWVGGWVDSYELDGLKRAPLVIGTIPEGQVRACVRACVRAGFFSG